jgi:hypothetical protein
MIKYPHERLPTKKKYHRKYWKTLTPEKKREFKKIQPLSTTFNPVPGRSSVEKGTFSLGIGGTPMHLNRFSTNTSPAGPGSPDHGAWPDPKRVSKTNQSLIFPSFFGKVIKSLHLSRRIS